MGLKYLKNELRLQMLHLYIILIIPLRHMTSNNIINTNLLALPMNTLIIEFQQQLLIGCLPANWE